MYIKNELTDWTKNKYKTFLQLTLYKTIELISAEYKDDDNTLRYNTNFKIQCI
jgi:hypothetical protein